MSTRQLWMTNPAQVAAAEHLIAATVLSDSLAITPIPFYGSRLRVDVDDDHRWSSGERVLIELLAAFSTEGVRVPSLSALHALDKETRMVAWTALGIASGVIASVGVPEGAVS